MMTYWLYRAVALLPLPVKYGLSTAAAFLLRRVFRYRARVIDTNLRNAFPERDADVVTPPRVFIASSPMSPWKSSMPRE
jgi:lauroyl/myristoyl acyltransferase